VDLKKIYTYLQNQKRRLLALDGAEEATGWLTEKEQTGEHFVARMNVGFDPEDPNLGRGRAYGLMEIAYDNVIKWLMDSRTGQKCLFNEHMKLSQPGVISEDTTTSNIATFTTSLLPAIRRIYADLLAMDLVSVQPLGGPSGYLYWIDHLFTSAYSADGITAAERIDAEQDSEGYTDSEEQGTIRQIQFRLQSELIETENKKVAGLWTLEAEQDLQSQWGLDLQSELIPEFGKLITREINRNIINALEAGAGAGDTEWNINTPDDDATSSAKAAYYQTLWHAIATTDTLIYNNKYQQADWLLMNASTYFYIQRLNNFRGNSRIENQRASISTRYVGTLNDMYRVYVDPHMSSNTIVMGIKGPTWKEACAYFCPYIPLFLSENYIYDDDFSQIMKGGMTRYAFGVIPEEKDMDVAQNNGIGTVTLTQS